MGKFLVIPFELYKAFHYSLILCKEKGESTEYRITVMNGDIQKQLCNNNTIQEINGSLLIELSGNKIQNQINREIAKALGRVVGMPVKEVDKPGEETGQQLPGE